MTIETYNKDPDEVLDYQFDWTSWLASGETISSATVSANTGLTVDSSTDDGSIVTGWISGGTAGTAYNVKCKIATNASRTGVRRIKINVKNR